MSIISTTYRCDWPGCTETITASADDPTYLSDHDWEGRCLIDFIPKYHACPVHRFKTSEEFQAAIDLCNLLLSSRKM